jgi:hypothetical protein
MLRSPMAHNRSVAAGISEEQNVNVPPDKPLQRSGLNKVLVVEERKSRTWPKQTAPQ